MYYYILYSVCCINNEQTTQNDSNLDLIYDGSQSEADCKLCSVKLSRGRLQHFPKIQLTWWNIFNIKLSMRSMLVRWLKINALTQYIVHGRSDATGHWKDICLCHVRYYVFYLELYKRNLQPDPRLATAWTTVCFACPLFKKKKKKAYVPRV